jgi:hypothetical protein
MSKDDLGEAIAGILLGIIGGLALVEILNRLFGKKCSSCNNPVQPDQFYCLKCGARLR